MTLKEYLNENEPNCISVLIAKKNGGTMSVRYNKDEYKNEEIMSKELLKYEVTETEYVEEDDCTEIWVIGGGI